MLANLSVLTLVNKVILKKLVIIYKQMNNDKKVG